MSATSTPSTPKQPLSERVETRQRVLTVAGWLVDGGALRHEAVQSAIKTWQVSRRTAQVYVQKAANRIARLTEYDDPLFALKLSQLQRGRLYQEMLGLLQSAEMPGPQHLRTILQTVSGALKVLDSRDRTAARIAQLESRGLAKSPSSKKSTAEAPVNGELRPSASTEGPPAPADAEPRPAPPRTVPLNRRHPRRNRLASRNLPLTAQVESGTSPAGANCALEILPVAQSA